MRVLAAPSSQRAPVQPRPQLQLPVAASHLPPLLQLQRWRQPSPNQPGGQPGIRPRTGLRASLFNYCKQNDEDYRTPARAPMSLMAFCGISPCPQSSPLRPGPHKHRPLTGSFWDPPHAATRAQSGPNRPAGQAETPRHGHVTHWLFVVYASPDGSFRLTGVAARSYKPCRTFACPGGRVTPPAVIALAFSFTVRTVTSFFTN